VRRTAAFTRFEAPRKLRGVRASIDLSVIIPAHGKAPHLRVPPHHLRARLGGLGTESEGLGLVGHVLALDADRPSTSHPYRRTAFEPSWSILGSGTVLSLRQA